MTNFNSLSMGNNGTSISIPGGSGQAGFTITSTDGRDIYVGSKWYYPVATSVDQSPLVDPSSVGTMPSGTYLDINYGHTGTHATGVIFTPDTMINTFSIDLGTFQTGATLVYNLSDGSTHTIVTVGDDGLPGGSTDSVAYTAPTGLTLNCLAPFLSTTNFCFL